MFLEDICQTFHRSLCSYINRCSSLWLENKSFPSACERPNGYVQQWINTVAMFVHAGSDPSWSESLTKMPVFWCTCLCSSNWVSLSFQARQPHIDICFAVCALLEKRKIKIQFLLNFQPTERKHFCWRTAVLLQVQNKEWLSLRCKFHTRPDKVAHKRFASQSAEQEPLHLKSIYLLLTLAFVRFWQQKVQKDGKWINGRVQNLSYQPRSAFSWEVHVKSALRWHEQTGSAVNHDHPSPGFNGLIVWISLTLQEEGESLNIPCEIFNDTMRTFFRAGETMAYEID